MGTQLIMIFVVVPFDGGVFDCAVHPLDLAVGPRMVGFGQPVLNPVGIADHVETHRPRIDCVPVSGQLGELDAIVGEYRVDPIRDRIKQELQELPSCTPVRLINELRDGELACSVYAYKEIKLSFCGLHLGNIQMKVANGVSLETLSLRFVTLDVRQPRDAMPLQAPMQRRASQFRN